MVNGIIIALGELFIFYKITTYIRNSIYLLNLIDIIPYYWIMFTILTGIWEFFYIINRTVIHNISKNLIQDKESVLTNSYNICYLLPWKFSNLFYAEYGAYADREYMSLKDNWSQIIEGSHSILCGSIMICAILSLLKSNLFLFNIYLSIGISHQLINSIIYMGQYLIQINTIYSINYNSIIFPCGKYLLKRPFIYINILYTIMPMYILYTILSEY